MTTLCRALLAALLLVVAGCSDAYVLEEPGQCFEVGGPEGIGHPPRVHDAGEVAVGTSIEVTVGFYHFCIEHESYSGPTSVLSATQGLDVSANGPLLGTEMWNTGATYDVTTVLTPTTLGAHWAVVRFNSSSGYYDFEVLLTGVAP